MAPATQPPKNIEELIDCIDLIREELLKIQRSMEAMAPVRPNTLNDLVRKKK